MWTWNSDQGLSGSKVHPGKAGSEVGTQPHTLHHTAGPVYLHHSTYWRSWEETRGTPQEPELRMGPGAVRRQPCDAAEGRRSAAAQMNKALPPVRHSPDPPVTLSVIHHTGTASCCSSASFSTNTWGRKMTSGEAERSENNYRWGNDQSTFIPVELKQWNSGHVASMSEQWCACTQTNTIRSLFHNYRWFCEELKGVYKSVKCIYLTLYSINTK